MYKNKLFLILSNDFDSEASAVYTNMYFAFGIDYLLRYLFHTDVSIGVWDSIIDFDDEINLNGGLQ